MRCGVCTGAGDTGRRGCLILTLTADGLRIGRFSCSAGVLFAGSALVFFGCDPLLTACLTAAMIHEMGHLLACVVVGIPVYGLRLTLAGAVLHLHSRSESGMEEVLIALAGPLLNLLTAAILLTLPHPTRQGLFLAGSSLLLGLFNLLPAAPLDGSRILHGLLSLHSLPFADRITEICTRVVHLLMLFPGLMCAWLGNPSLLILVLWMLLRNIKLSTPTVGSESSPSCPR